MRFEHGSRLSLNEARRLVLGAQGFDRRRPGGRVDVRHLRRTIRRLGLLQIDFVNVLVPAHYLVLFSRLGPYDRWRLDDLVYRRREFSEQWAHEASILPVEDWPLLGHRRETHRVRPWGFESFLKEQSAYVSWVLEEVRARGPLTAHDLAELDDSPIRISDRWGWGLAVRRQVLEAHFGFGHLAVAERRPNFQRVYDLAQRVIPEEHLRKRIGRKEAQRELLRLAARACGLGTAADLADYYRMPVGQARRRLKELTAEGLLLEVKVEGWTEPAYLHPEARLPRRIEAAALISPFDPLIWCRPRTARLFGFDYRIEIYVPRPKRRWGYYVLPFLHRGRLVARVDLKADRARSRLLVPAAYLEEGAPNDTAAALAMELRQLADWLGLEEFEIGARGNLSPGLKQEFL